MTRNIGLRVLIFCLVVTTIGCDRITKHLATDRLAGGSTHSYLSDTLRFEYVRNPGGFLSLGAGLPARPRLMLFSVGTTVLLIALIFVAMKRRWSGAALTGATLVCAGGASNLVDRLMHGSVVDFINVGVGSLRTGIFNVADMAVLGGALLLALASRDGSLDKQP